MTAPTNKTYTIATVTDFDAVPKDRIGVCLQEFALWLVTGRYLKRITKGTVRFPDAFEWADDGRGVVEVTVRDPVSGETLCETVFLQTGMEGK